MQIPLQKADFLMNLKFSVKEIVESAMLISIAVVLDLKGLKIQLWPDGGSVSFTMVPLFLLAIRMGPLKGFVGIGIVYGGITCLIDGWGIQTFPFDYLLAYGSLSVIGFFSKFILDEKKPGRGLFFLLLGIVIGLLLRLVFACVSSMIIYEYELMPALGYNIPYIFFAGVITILAMLVLYKPLLITNKKFPLKSID